MNAAIFGLALPLSVYLAVEGYEARSETKLAYDETCVVNASATDLFMNPDFTPEVDPELCLPEYRSCHDELKSTLPILISFMEEKGVSVPDLPHCTTVNSFAKGAQDSIVGAADILSSILYTIGDIFADNHIENAKRTNLFEDSYFLKGAEAISEPLQDLLNLINRGENAIHLPLGLMFIWVGYMSVFRARNMSNDEWQHFKDDMANIWNEMSSTRPMNFLVPILSTALYLKEYGWNASETLIDQNVMMIAFGGAIAGYLLHKYDAKFRNNKKQAFEIAQDMQTVSMDFETNALPLSEQLAAERPERMKKLRKRAVEYGAAASGYSAVIAADISGAIDTLPEGVLHEFAAGTAEFAGMAPVVFAITIPSVVYNFLIEDPAQHIAFIGGGYSAGFTAGTAALATILAAKYTKDVAVHVKSSFNDGAFSGEKLISAFAHKPSFDSAHSAGNHPEHGHDHVHSCRHCD